MYIEEMKGVIEDLISPSRFIPVSADRNDSVKGCQRVA